MLARTMTIDWVNLATAVVLLWFPMLLPRELFSRLDVRPQPPTIRPSWVLRRWLNWIDMVRAALGSWILVDLTFVVLEGKAGKPRVAFAIVGAVLLVGVLAQALRYRTKLHSVLPVCYVTGLVAGGLPLDMSAFAIFVGWAFGFALKNIHPTPLILAVAVGILSYALKHFALSSIAIAAVVALPHLISVLMLQRPLLLMTAPRFE